MDDVARDLDQARPATKGFPTPGGHRRNASDRTTVFGDEVLMPFGVDLVQYSQTPRLEFTRGQSSLALATCLLPSLGHGAVPVANANDWTDDQSSGQKSVQVEPLHGARERRGLLPLAPAELLAKHAEVVEARIADQEHAIG